MAAAGKGPGKLRKGETDPYPPVFDAKLPDRVALALSNSFAQHLAENGASNDDIEIAKALLLDLAKRDVDRADFHPALDKILTALTK